MQMRRIFQYLSLCFGLRLLLAVSNPSAFADVSYIYDAGGRLLAAFDGNGNLTNYQYDQADNITAILTGSATVEAVFGYSPDHGSAGTQVTIYGNNFGSNPIVTFSSGQGSVISSGATQIVVAAPGGLGCPNGTVTVSSSTGNATGPTFYCP